MTENERLLKACKELSDALSKIDVLIHRYLGESNDMDFYAYDFDYDPEGVVSRLKQTLEMSVLKSGV